MFDFLDTIVPAGKNKVKISKIDLDIKEGTINLEAEARNGFEALEVFKKTIAATVLKYNNEDGDAQDPIDVASEITDSDVVFSTSSSDGKVLRFSISFVYAPEIFDPSAEDGKFVGPDKQNATDSARSVPKSLFTDGVKSDEEEQ